MVKAFGLRWALLLLMLASFGGPVLGQSALTVNGDQFLYDGKPFDMWGIRTASATKDAAQTERLIAQLDAYKAHGVNTVTVFYQGSSGASYDPFAPDGLSVDTGHQTRMEQIIRACQQRGMVVIVGIFYQNAPLRLKNAEAVRNAVRTVARKLKPYRNIIINVVNEQNSNRWKDTADIYDFRDPQHVIELCEIVHAEDARRLVGGGGYDHDKNVVIGRSPAVDALLFDTGEPPPTSGQLYDRFLASGVTAKPMVNVELFGGWTDQFPRGVFQDAVKKAYYDEVDAAVSRKGLYVFFFSTPWTQGEPMRYDLAGDGTTAHPGIRWYFEYVRNKLRTTKPTQRNHDKEN